jgi:carbamoyl-phosphate synthase small subunit
MMKDAILTLQDGTIFRGKAFGATTSLCGEVCFNTSMTGYQEILTDPSYKAQIVTMTYPLIGNYGINTRDIESYKPHLSGFVVRELSPTVSNWRADTDLDTYLKANGVPGIQGIDTRALTKRLRVEGAMNGFLSTEDVSDEEAVKKASSWPGLTGVDYVKKVTHQKDFTWDEDETMSPAFRLIHGNESGDPRNASKPLPTADINIVAMDFGIKYNILRRLRQTGFRTHVVPANTSAAEIKDLNPQGVFLSNGPGDPSAVDYAIQTVTELADHGFPMFGICLGHQIMGQALGGKTFKMKFGHRGGNQPVKDLETGMVEITSQNHGFALDTKSMPAEVKVDRINLNDNTVEGLHHTNKPMFSVQYHPEASPGPHDASSLFQRFRDMIAGIGS